MFRLSSKIGLVICLTEMSLISRLDKKENEMALAWVGSECAISILKNLGSCNRRQILVGPGLFSHYSRSLRLTRQMARGVASVDSFGQWAGFQSHESSSVGKRTVVQTAIRHKVARERVDYKVLWTLNRLRRSNIYAIT